VAAVELSVVVPVSDGCWRLAQSLTAAGRAVHDLRAEVIAVDGSSDGSGDAVPPEAPFTRVPAPRTSNAASLRAQGVSRARGEIVALLEPWSFPHPEWGRAILDAHRQSAASDATVVGGPVVYDGPDRGWAWAEFLFEYAAFLPPFSGQVEELAVNNVSYRAELLESVRAFWEKGFWKHFLHRELRARGARFLATPDAAVSHARPVPFARFLRERVDHGRAYAARRGGSAARAAIAPLLPVLLTTRVRRRLRGKPEALRAFSRALPALLVAEGAWAVGEFLGHVAGDGGSSARVF
jgi:hypothetical protein